MNPQAMKQRATVRSSAFRRPRSSKDSRQLEVPFTLLHHTGMGKPHYDLLLDIQLTPQQKDRVPAWRLTSPPSRWTLSTPATRNFDHRRLYLTYEGEISNDRGRVRRHA